MNKKLYGFRLKGTDIIDLFNDSDLYGFDKNDNGKWELTGFSWLVCEPHYIINAFHDIYNTDEWEQITEAEFNEIARDDDTISEFGYTMIDKSYPIEKMFNMHIEYVDIDNMEVIERFPYNATFTNMAEPLSYGEPCYMTYREISTYDNIEDIRGHYRVVY